MRRPLALDLLLSVGAVALFTVFLEGGARLWEKRRAPLARAVYLWDWQQKWDGDFYTMRTDGMGWPPWEEVNVDGLRDRTHGVEKPEGVWRVAFLGDSVTYGDHIAARQAYPQVVQARLDHEGRGVEVFNVALMGWSTRQERIAYERLLRRYRPDQVVLAVCLNDIPELQNNLARPPAWLHRLHGRSALVRTVVNAQGREIASVEELFEEEAPARVAEAFSRFFDEVRGLRQEVRADGADLSLIVFPFRFQVQAGAPPPRAQARIAEFCRAEGLRCLDLLPELARRGEAAFVDYDHLSVAGAQAVAEALLTADLIPARPQPAEVLAAAGVPSAKDGLRATAPEVRAAAAAALGRAPLDSPIVKALVQALADPAESVRREAARTLGGRGESARPAVPALLTALRDGRQSVRWQAAQSLARLGLDPARDVAALVALLRHDDDYIAGFAAWSLGNMGPAGRAAVPELVAALDGPVGYTRGGPVAALARIGPSAAPAVPALLDGLNSQDWAHRWKAARTLGRIGPPAAAAVPALVRALQDEHEYVRLHAVRALGRLGAPAQPAVSDLARAGHDLDEAVRREAQKALGRLRDAARPVVDDDEGLAEDQ